MAGERPGHTLQPTALVHEAWLRLSDGNQKRESRRHFFAAAAEAMRLILIDRARHGGGEAPLTLEQVEIVIPGQDEEWLALGEALEKLVSHDKPTSGRPISLSSGTSWA